MIEFFFDCSSPWTWLAFHNIRPMMAELAEPIRFRPILVGGVFNTVNPSVYQSRQQGVPAKQAYMRKDLRDWAQHSGLDIRFPPTVFPVNSVKVMRACIALEPSGRLETFADAAFRAYWTRDQDISRDDVIRELCAQTQIDATWLFEAIGQPAVKDQLRVNTDELIARGGFGSPSMFLGDDMYFGNDRLVLLRDAVLRQRALSQRSLPTGPS